MKTFITHEKGNDEAWICVCRNTPTGAGFYPVNSKGEQCEPTKEEWDTDNYICNNCGRIINPDTFEVVGMVEGYPAR